MERQSHGFIFEKKYIVENNLTEEKQYLSKYDAYDKLGTPYQIKCIKKGSSIDLGDIFRNADKRENFFLIIGFWENKKDNIVEIHKLYILHDRWNDYLYFNEYDDLKKWLKNVSNDKSYDLQWKQEIKEWKLKFGVRKISIRFKRDHKTQKRIQCAINNKIFYEHFVPVFGIK